MTKYASTDQIKGVGDVIAKATKIIHLDTIVKRIVDQMGVDCGCDRRRETLNRIFPIRKK